MSRADFTNTLNNIIEDRGLSNEDLRKKMGTNKVFIERLRNGEVNLTLEIMEKIAERLGCVLKIEFKVVENGN